jgi:hypothetical protein
MCPGFLKIDRYSLGSSLGPGHMLSLGIPKVYFSTMQLLSYPFNVGLTVFFCLSARRVNEERSYQFRFGEVELSFKEFLASPPRMRFQVLRSFFFSYNYMLWG